MQFIKSVSEIWETAQATLLTAKSYNYFVRNGRSDIINWTTIYEFGRIWHNPRYSLDFEISFMLDVPLNTFLPVRYKYFII